MVAPKLATGVGGRVSRLERVTGGDPPVVAAVEQADVVDARVVQDGRGPGCRDLAGPASRPLLVGLADGVTPVEDHRRVVRDPQRAERGLELVRRTSVPVGRILEPVRVEVERPGQVAVGVLLRHPEVDVEEEEPIPVVRLPDARRR